MVNILSAGALHHPHKQNARKTGTSCAYLQGFHDREIQKYSIGQGGEVVATQVKENDTFPSGGVQARCEVTAVDVVISYEAFGKIPGLKSQKSQSTGEVFTLSAFSYIVSEPVRYPLPHECSVYTRNIAQHMLNKRVVSQEGAACGEKRRYSTKQRGSCNPRRSSWNVIRGATTVFNSGALPFTNTDLIRLATQKHHRLRGLTGFRQHRSRICSRCRWDPSRSSLQPKEHPGQTRRGGW